MLSGDTAGMVSYEWKTQHIDRQKDRQIDGQAIRIALLRVMICNDK